MLMEHHCTTEGPTYYASAAIVGARVVKHGDTGVVVLLDLADGKTMTIMDPAAIHEEIKCDRIADLDQARRQADPLRRSSIPD
jgi:hypothetical protein